MAGTYYLSEYELIVSVSVVLYRYDLNTEILSIVLQIIMTIFSLDDSRPFLSYSNNIIMWESGGISARLSSSKLLRIHSRGVVFSPLDWKMRNLKIHDSWRYQSNCVPSHEGLCKIWNDSVVYFPTKRQPYVNELMWDIRCKAINQKSTMRILTTQNIYEPSACDVLDAGYDFVYSGGDIFYRDSSIESWVYWAICILIIFLVRCLSKYILVSLSYDSRGPSVKKDVPNSLICFIASIATIFLTIRDGDAMFVTEEDLTFYWFCFAYTIFYALIFLLSRITKLYPWFWPFSYSLKDPPFYNLLSGVLQLTACRFYFGVLTPYNPPIIAVLSIRALVKSRRKVPDMVCASTLLFDSFMISMLCVLGFYDSREFLVAIFCGVLAWTDYLV